MQQTTDLVCQEDGARLDTYVASLYPAKSRSQAQTLIRERYVRVNGAVRRPATRLRCGDNITVTMPDPEPSALAPQWMRLHVVHEDDHVIVVEKPAGLIVHPGSGHSSGTLANALLARYPEIEHVGSERRPGIVQRLDADTSGLLVVARTPLGYQRLIEEMRQRTVGKTYLALVRGHPRPPSGSIDAPIGRHPADRKRMAVVSTGRPALTEYRSRRRYKGFALLEVRIHTGRTHQIRVHLSAIGHPVAGDARYGGRVPFLGRQFLHASRLAFRHPLTGAYLQFTSQLPQGLSAVLHALQPLQD